VDLGRWVARNSSAAADQRDPACPEARVADQALAFLRTARFDLVLFQEFLGHGARALQAHGAGSALHGARTATTLHSCRQWIYEGMQRQPQHAGDVAVDFLEKESARAADRVLAPSAHMARWAADHWHLARDIDVVPYCYDAALAAPRQTIEHRGPFRHLVFFGRLETRKGVHLFCRALARNPALAKSLNGVTFLGKQSSVEGLPSEEFIRRTLSAVPGLNWTIKSDLGSLEALAWLSAQPEVLVVAPSLVDNLPYSLIELYCRHMPFVSTAIGGIPEIVGEANRHVLAPASVDGVGEVLARVCRDERLVVDYRSGYDIAAANAAHLNVVCKLLDAPARKASPRARSLSIVVTSSRGEADVERVRSRFVAADPTAAAASWFGFAAWRESRSRVEVPDRSAEGPVVFVDEHVRPDTRLLSSYLTALTAPGVEAVTSYYYEGDSDDPALVAPLGASLEAGWWQNCFGGPCVAISAKALAAVDDITAETAFGYWPAYAALACRGLRQTVVPDPLFAIGDTAWRTKAEESDTVVREYHARAADQLDLGWLLKSAGAGIGWRQGESVGRELYRKLTSSPDDVVRISLGDSPGDPALHDILRLRDRLMTAVQRWNGSAPRVFVYGAGQHAKLTLQICPEIGPLVAGFIDRRPLAAFLGRPCIRPEAFDASMADAVVYCSPEFEGEMHRRLQHLPVEHVLLYGASPETPAPTSSVRLQNRFGHAAPDFKPLHAMYRPPSWATGYISRGDAEFLFEMIAAHRPRAVVELGVASGASSAAILCAMDQLPEIPGGRVLYSCDVRPTCYFNETFATGRACTEMYPVARTRWRTEFDADARRLARALPRGSVDLTFIDANHAHPWPLLDLLHVTAVAKPRSWVVLHDVDLPIHYPEYQVYGPRWLFEAWPFNKVKGAGRWVSIAAVQLPDDAAALVPMAQRLLAKPWEHAPTMWHINLPKALSVIQDELRQRLAPEDAAVAS
jgi:glycosyltransferase involved in cell wall biosynthesis/predicted O-methyltransferase YrrM